MLYERKTERSPVDKKRQCEGTNIVKRYSENIAKCDFRHKKATARVALF